MRSVFLLVIQHFHHVIALHRARQLHLVSV
jgi:hypothetical protein